MSVIIKDMNMPANCLACPFSKALANNVFCYRTGKFAETVARQADCPLEPYEPEKEIKPEYREAGARLYIKYMNGEPVKYAFGEEWVSTALFMDDIGYDTAEEALAAWLKEQ